MRILRGKIRNIGLASIVPGALVSIICCCIVAYLSTICVGTLAYESMLKTYADTFFSYPLPPGTEEVERHADVDLAPGASGSHCDFIASRSLLTVLSCQEMDAYFREAEFPGASGTRRYPPWLDVDCDEQQGPDGLLRVTVTLTDWNWPAYHPRCW